MFTEVRAEVVEAGANVALHHVWFDEVELEMECEVRTPHPRNLTSGEFDVTEVPLRPQDIT